MPSAFASVARKAVHAAPESNTARMDTYSVASPAATCNFALRHPVLAAWRYTLSDASVPHTTVIESLVCSVSLSHRSRTIGPCHVHAGLIISSILAADGAAHTGGDCNASIPASANVWWLLLAVWSRLAPPAMAVANNACAIWCLSFLGPSVVVLLSLIEYRLPCMGALLSRGLLFSSIRRISSRFANSCASARDMPCDGCIVFMR